MINAMTWLIPGVLFYVSMEFVIEVNSLQQVVQTYVYVDGSIR
jgi:hypothetical protein